MKIIYFLVLAICPLIARSQIITTIAGNGGIGYAGDGGAATAATFNQPDGMCVDGAGNCYIADWNNFVIRKVSAAGVITTVAGTGTTGYSTDGGQATNAKLMLSNGGVAVDNSGNLYIADIYRVRKVNSSGIISTVAGNGSATYSGDGGAATNAGLVAATGVKVDAAGNIYIADRTNYRIRKVNSAGIISTIAGNGTAGYTGDGGAATNATLDQPANIALDVAGNIYIADGGNNVVRKVSTSGIITTYAGGGTSSGSAIGDGGPATAAALAEPYDVATDAGGNLFIADFSHFSIRKVNASGIISTIAGDGNVGFSGDGGPATAAEIGWNLGIATDNAGNLYIADGQNGRIRKVKLNATAVDPVTIERPQITLMPNPARAEITIVSDKKIASLLITDLVGRLVYANKELPSTAQIDISNWPSGPYFLKINNIESRVFIKE